MGLELENKYEEEEREIVNRAASFGISFECLAKKKMQLKSQNISGEQLIRDLEAYVQYRTDLC